MLGRVWRLFGGDRALIAVATVATVLNAAAAAVIFGGATWLLDADYTLWLIGPAFLVLALPTTCVSTYCCVALLTIADARFDGRGCTAREGFTAASRRLPAILGWSLLAVGVGALLDWIAQWIPFVGDIASWLFGVAWSVATMFAVPVLALEEGGPRHAARRSAEIFRARWGEGLVGEISVTAVALALTVPALAVLIVGFVAGGPLGIALAAAGAAVLVAVATAANAVTEIYGLVLYRHYVLGGDAGALGLAPEQLDAVVQTTRRGSL